MAKKQKRKWDTAKVCKRRANGIRNGANSTIFIKLSQIVFLESTSHASTALQQ